MLRIVRQKIPDDSFKLVCTNLGTVELFLKSVNATTSGTLPRVSANNKHRGSNGFFEGTDYKNMVFI